MFSHLNACISIQYGLKFGEAVALYFAFLNSYTLALLFISVAGLANFYFGHAYSLLYSSFLFLWSLVFVEYWRIRERIHSAAWGCLGSVRVEHHRPRYVEGDVWWKRELKVLVSVPVIVLFASLLAILLTAIFVLEAFVTELYTGPGHQYMVSGSRQPFISESLTCPPVVCPNGYFYNSHTSLPCHLSGPRSEANSMGKPQAPVCL